MRVAVFCSSSANIEKRYVDLAYDLGTALALNNIDLVWGGGQVSMMGAVAKAVRQGGRKTYGVIPEHLTNLELSDPEADEMFIVDTMRNRKQKMDDLSDAFIIMPGGIGTLEEFFEIWVGRFLKFHDKPIVILDPFDLYQPLLNLIEHLERENFVKPGQRELLFWAKDVEQALDFISKQ
mgnify:CR=1 FL=1